jgi:signal transduction histidine kinase
VATAANVERWIAARDTNPRVRHLCNLAAAFSILALVSSAIVLVGWAIHSPLLVSFVPGFVAMNPIVAASFVALSILLLLSLIPRVVPGLGPVRALVAGVILLISFSRLGSQIIDLGLDQLLFPRRLALVPGLPPNRMAFATALAMGFTALGIMMLDVTTRRGRRPAEFAALASMLIALLGFLGYSYRVSSLYQFGAVIPMALHASINFLLLTAAILSARSDRGLMGIATSDTLGGVAARRLLPAAVLVPAGLGWLRIISHRLGFADTELTVSLLIIVDTLFFVLLIWSTSGLLLRADEMLRQRSVQLMQTEKLASLGQMVAGVAHEINNPLSFVSNNVAVLQRDVAALQKLLELYRQADAGIAASHPELAGQIRQFAEQIDLTYTLANVTDLTGRSREGLRRIQQIVKDLRDFARLDEGELQQADLNAGIESTINIIQGRARKKQVIIEKDLGSLPTLWCFPAKVNQVVMNLIANAIDACPDAGKVIVRSHAEADALCIEVIDNGPGIDATVRRRIFDPFFTTKPPGEGTGLGLSISYAIIQEHQGSIEVFSEIGQGARFTVRLPRMILPTQAR